MLDNIVSIITTIVGLLVAFWRFTQSPIGQALISSIQQGSSLKAREFLEKQAVCVATKYQQVFVAGLREDAADGKITKEELKKRLLEIKSMALADFKASAEGGAVASALAVVGVKDMNLFLDQLLEGAVFRLKSMAAQQGLNIPKE